MMPGAASGNVTIKNVRAGDAYPKKRFHGGELADWRIVVQSVPRKV